MAAIPSAINLLDSHLSADINGKAANYTPIAAAYSSSVLDDNDKQQLVDPRLEEEGQRIADADRGDIRQQLQRIWPFRVLKATNWLLLLALAIGASVCAENSIVWWSDYWKALAPMYRDRPFDLSLEYAIGQCILLGLATLSLLTNGCLSCKRVTSNVSTSTAAILALMDLCISALCIPLLLVTTMYFSMQTIAEYRWFLPKLAHFNGTKEALADLTAVPLESPSYYHRKDDEWKWAQMGIRQREIRLHLLADPLISFLCVLAVLANLGLVVCLCRMMRRANLWATIGEQQNRPCSPFDRQYARHYPFGMLKNLQWILPALTVFAFLYVPLFRIHSRDNEFLLLIGLISVASFGHWLFYFCAVHLRQSQQMPTGSKEEEQAPPPHRLLSVFFMDCLISMFAFGNLLYHLLSGQMRSEHQIVVCWMGIALYGTSLTLCCLLFWQHRAGFELMPHISVQIHIKVGRNGNEGEKKLQTMAAEGNNSSAVAAAGNEQK